jgi:hypothetical protein
MPKKQSQLTAASVANDEDEMNMVQAGTSKRVRRDLVAPLPMNYIAGLITSNNGSDALHDIDIAVGVARDNTDVENMRLTSILTKQIDAVWAVGTNQGGLDTGAVAAFTIYAIWLIKRSDTGVVDVLLSTSFTAPTMPTNYDRKRLIGAVRTDVSADILPYLQVGDYFRYLSFSTEISDGTITDATYEDGTLLVPPRSLAHIYAAITNFTSTAAVDGKLWIRTKGATDPSTGSSNAFMIMLTASDFDNLSRSGFVLVDSASQIQYAAAETTGSATVNITSLGFRMLTRRDP